MGSTEPVNNDHCPTTGASTCGLVGSLFPRSCRGRAEAFARRLHRRLTSLNGDDIDGEVGSLEKPNESSWLQSSNHQDITASSRVLDHQPRHSPETDLYYDFDASEQDDPGSPEEVVTADELATLLVNHSELLKTNHHSSCHCTAEIRPPDDARDGYTYSSPNESNTTSESDAYYDPESSETDKTKTDDFFDPIQSDSEMTFQLTNGDNKNPHKSSGRRRAELTSDTSEESSMSQVNEPKKIPKANSSEESLNDVVSSLETTSASHESLWSTFDDSTLSLQDEATSVVALPCETRFLKSHSDSELVPGARSIVPEPETKLESESIDEVDSANPNGSIKVHCNGVDKTQIVLEEESSCNHLNNSLTDDLPGNLEVECSTEQPSSLPERTFKNEATQRIIENGETTDEDVSELLKKLSCSKRPSFDHSFDADNGTEDADDQDNDDDDDEDDRPQRLRRCSSLKTGKTPPSTPGRKKIVRFADVLGLDLADVRTFLDEIPKVPNSAYSDLIYDDNFQKDSSPSLYGSSPTTADTSGGLTCLPGTVRPDKMLVAMFQQPGGSMNFIDLIQQRQVCLENVVVIDPIMFCLQGTVRVRNLDYHKSVHVRYTMDSWKTFSDLQALHVDGSCDGFSDKFQFTLYCHTLKIGEKLELAVRFQCKGSQFWDNNAGINYAFHCLPMTPVSHYVPITTLANPSRNHDWNPTFY